MWAPVESTVGYERECFQLTSCLCHRPSRHVCADTTLASASAAVDASLCCRAYKINQSIPSRPGTDEVASDLREPRRKRRKRRVQCCRQGKRRAASALPDMSMMAVHGNLDGGVGKMPIGMVGRRWEDGGRLAATLPHRGWGLGGWRRQAGGLDRVNGRASPQLSAIGPAYR